MEILERMEITVSFKNGYRLTLTVTDPKQMWRIAKLSNLWPTISQVLESYRAYAERKGGA